MVNNGAVAKSVQGAGSGGGQDPTGRGRHQGVNRLQQRTRSQTPKRPRVDDELAEDEVQPYNQQGHQEDRSGNGWEDGNRRKYRSNGAKVVRGTAGVAAAASAGGAGGVRQGWKSAPREVFVYHTHHSTTEEDIRDLIAETSKVEVLEVEKRSREGAYFGSFRVRVNRDEFEKAMAPECWPSGWSVREYFVARKKPEADHQGQTSQTQTNPNRS